MNFHVTNYQLEVCDVHVGAVASSSIFLIGDAYWIQLHSMFDTPPESLIITLIYPTLFTLRGEVFEFLSKNFHC